MNWTALGKGLLVAIALHLALAIVIGWAQGLAWLGQTYGHWAAATVFSLTFSLLVVFLVYKSEDV